MKCLRVGPLWGVAVLSCGVVACTDQHPPLPFDLTMQAAKPAGVGVVKVDATDPSSAEQETTLDVRVLGSGFDDGSTATWLLAGDPKPNQVKTNSTRFLSSTELEANITIALDATVALWDVEVGKFVPLFLSRTSLRSYSFPGSPDIVQPHDRQRSPQPVCPPIQIWMLYPDSRPIPLAHC